MSSKHTPGPWEFTKDAGKPPCRFINADCFDDIATLRGPHDWPIQDANARLIAAAPELLEACEMALRWVEADEATHGRRFPTGDTLRTAIRKATGE